jgi:tetratricopeptide (TPR) repeat protein
MKKKKSKQAPPKIAFKKTHRDSILLRYEKLIVVAIFVLALILKLLHLQQIKNNNPFFALPAIDSHVYHMWAVEISNGNWLGNEVFFNSPLYPFILALIYKISGQSIFGAKFIQFLLGSFNCILIYLVGKKVFHSKVALIAGLMTALYVMFTFYEGSLLITNIQIPLNLVLILVLLNNFERPSQKKWLFSGMCLGLSALARPNILIFALFVIFWIIFRLKEHMAMKQILLSVASFCIGIGLIVFPVTIRNYIIGNEIVLINSSGGMNFYIGNNPDATGYFEPPKIMPFTSQDHPLKQKENYKAYAENKTGRPMSYSEVSEYWYSEGMKFIRNNPKKWMGLVVKKFLLFINHYEIWNIQSYYFSKQFSWVLRMPLLTFGIVAPFALFGILLSLKYWKHHFLLYAIILSYAVSSLIYFSVSRYRMPAIPFFIVFASYAFYWLFENVLKKNIKNLTIAFLSIVLLYVIVNQNLVNISHFKAHYNLGNKYMQMEKWELAVEQYNRSIQQYPKFIAAHYNLAVIYEMKLGQYDDAIREWHIVRKLGKKMADQEFIKRADRHLKTLNQHKSIVNN